MKDFLHKINIFFLSLIIFGFINASTSISQAIFYEDFESSWGSWWADNGIWDVGIPSVGPATTHSGQNCAGTILDGTYPNNANTHLISPEINLPSLAGNEKIQSGRGSMTF